MTRAVLKKDLAVLWASPIPYVVGALLHLALGLLYIDQLEVRRQAVIQPLFPLAGFLLLVMVPLLTMRAFAEEARTGTLDVLQAVPVPARVLVVGKWLATWITAAVVFAPALLFVVLLAWYGDPDAGPMVAGFLGLLLFTASLTAVGVLASTLTSSQPVAAIVALFVALVFWFADLGDDAPQAGSVLLRFSLRERLRSFASGVIDTADVAFFVLLLVGALVLAGQAVASRRLR
jgi:ABC-2 type transport system permease protein